MDYQRFTVAPSDGGVPPSDPPPHSSSSRIVHFTSSAFRNGWQPKVAAFAAQHLGRREPGADRLCRRQPRLHPHHPAGAHGGDDAAGEARPLRARLHREPVILPTEGWKNRHPIRTAGVDVPGGAAVRHPHRRRALRRPGHRRVHPDARPERPRRAGAAAGRRRPATAWSGRAGRTRVATALHAANVEGAVVTRTLVFANNVGVVTFGRANPPTVVPADGCRWRSTSCGRIRSARTRSPTPTCAHARSAGPRSADGPGPRSEGPDHEHQCRLTRPPDPNTHAGRPELGSRPGSAACSTTSCGCWPTLRAASCCWPSRLGRGRSGAAGRSCCPGSISRRRVAPTRVSRRPRSFAEVLVALAAFTEALVNVPDSQASRRHGAELVADFLDAIMAPAACARTIRWCGPSFGCSS